MGSAAATAGVWLAAAGAGLVTGTAWQLQQPALWAASTYGVLAAAAGLVGWGASAWRVRSAHGRTLATVTVWMLAWALLGVAGTGWRASQRLAHELPGALEGADLTLVGVVASLPQCAPESCRFRFEVEAARLHDMPTQVPPRLALGWYADARAAVPALRAGQRWQLAVRLKRPHGNSNPHGFDYELLLFEQGVRATGSVRALPASRNRLLAEAAGHPVDRLRQSVRDALAEHLTADGAREAGVLAALSIGDQAAIDRAEWALYRNTGVAHLMSISGINVHLDL